MLPVTHDRPASGGPVNDHSLAPAGTGSTDERAMGETLVEMDGISKDFPGVHALADCRFELRSGEVHALVGENGAGKSTLMKILAGVYHRDAGQIRIKGEPVEIDSPRAAQNIFIGREPRANPSFILDEDELNAQARALFETMHLALDPRVRVGRLAVAQQQMVEIAKALSFDSNVLIMDEPTAALTDTEIR